MKGMGKTTLMRQVYAARIGRGGRGVFVDPLGINGDLGTVVAGARELATRARAAVAGGASFSLVLQPGWRGVDPLLWRVLYALGDLLVALDEAQVHGDAKSGAAGDFGRLIETGRNRRVDMIAAVRRPPELPGGFRGNSDVVISFRQPSALYADSLSREFFGGSRAIAQELQRLPQFHYLRVHEGRITRGRIDPPGR